SGAGACTHPLGLPSSVLSQIDKPGGTANVGLFLMLRAVVLGVSAEGAGGLFENADANGVFQLFSRILFGFGGYNFPVASGSFEESWESILLQRACLGRHICRSGAGCLAAPVGYGGLRCG